MNRNRKLFAMAMIAGFLLLSPARETAAFSEGRGAGGEPYATGGIGQESRALLEARRGEFNVWITTAAKRSGAFLSGVRISVTDAANRQALSATLDGPLMLIRLAPGQYRIEASVDGQKQQQSFAVPARGQRELYFYFDVAADTLPEESAAKDDAPKRKR